MNMLRVMTEQEKIRFFMYVTGENERYTEGYLECMSYDLEEAIKEYIKMLGWK